MVDRAANISRFFPLALDMGCGQGHIAKTATADVIGTLYQTEMADRMLVRQERHVHGHKYRKQMTHFLKSAEIGQLHLYCIKGH